MLDVIITKIKKSVLEKVDKSQTPCDIRMDVKWVQATLRNLNFPVAQP